MAHIPLLNPLKTALGSISSIDSLCEALNITREDLEEALQLDPSEKYVRLTTPKKDGSDRVIFKPDYRLRKIQRRINKRIFSNQNVVTWPSHLFGSIPNQFDADKTKIEKDYVACARSHCESKSILKIDIKNFFDNIHQHYVEDIFLNFFKYPEDVSSTLAEICCHESHVVQGALTSSYIASLCLYDVEGETVRRLTRKGLTYTRLVDDITVSSKIADYNFDYTKNVIETMLVGKELPINSSKTITQYISTTALTVHGLRVGFKEPRLPSDEVRRIRSAVKNVETLAKEDSYRTSHGYRRDFNRVMGRVNKLSRVKHKQHASLVKRMRIVLPLPSKKDIDRTTRIVERLLTDYASRHDTYWYWRRFFLAHERLNVLQRSFPEVSKHLRKKLKLIKPTYE
ncbi:Retron-type RNA-directed DNA polymerase [Paraburkholderia caribensis MBA4]|uniref:Retron-type RNA-directed DNA polymerase n=1 Tax=Paraburkholderia caribensis MBA4 TaxID=1323664 RepID=A0A0P0RCA4_9BURK|nr:reverse transcriptase family protein [Paraburkholderia caribensis]ALL66139.1 Retron-type RNA-directed DNA polymerase [Paraburkholderia caribensis MBA4]